MRLAGLLLSAALAVACGAGDDPVAEASPTAAAPTATARTNIDGDWWRPEPSLTWQWQLQGEVNTSYAVAVYDIDLFDSEPALIESLHAAGRRVICYFSAGSAENWRPDFADFAEADVGEPLDGWEGERWVDIRSQGCLPSCSRASTSRSSAAATAWSRTTCRATTTTPASSSRPPTSSRSTAASQTRRTHEGWRWGSRTAGGQVVDLVDWYDFALNEECHEYEECSDFEPFIAAGKPVLNVEYRDSRGKARELAEDVCPQANAAGLRTLILPLELDDSFRVACFES